MGLSARPTESGQPANCRRWPPFPAGMQTCSPARSAFPRIRSTRPVIFSRPFRARARAPSGSAWPVTGISPAAQASDALYMWTTFRQYYALTDRRRPALTLERDGHPPVGHVFLGVVSNTAPWTYVGSRPVNPSPRASFGSGLDVFALRRLRTVSTLNALRQMLSGKNKQPNGRHVLALHDEPEVTVRSDRPIAFQVDGEYMGEHECVAFRAVPDALRVTTLNGNGHVAAL